MLVKRSSSQRLTDLGIGILDSGIGGLTVHKALEAILHQEDFIYFGDQAHFPYGNRTTDEIIDLTLKAAEFLMEHDIKILVIACHTMSIAASETLKKTLPIPVFDMLSPTLQLALDNPSIKRLAIWGTAYTISSKFYEILLKKENPSLEITSQNSSKLISMIEENEDFEVPLNQLISSMQPKAQALLLACTHFPIISPFIQKKIPSMMLLDPAQQCALNVKSYLEKNALSAKRMHGKMIRLAS